ncbi:related to Cytochrome c mitochondrial import factor CYC2 [Zygosaccharomyces bailii ISA1307]|nr:related to Cytochrome c mitochondrial import factor CYC2 [Zygosaccharomyces bailii ISA1307]
MRPLLLPFVLRGNLRRYFSGSSPQTRKIWPFWLVAGRGGGGSVSYCLRQRENNCELSPDHFTPYRISYKKNVDSSHFLMELTPLQEQRINMWAKMSSDRLWSVEIKQPDVMVVRSYTPLPLQVEKESGHLKLLPDGENAGGAFLLYLKKYGNGEVARWLNGLPEGHIIEVSGPFVEYELPLYEEEVSRNRDFFFDDKIRPEEKFKYKPIDIAMFTAGTGIASALQMLLTESPLRGKMLLCYSCGTIEELGPLKPFLNQLQKHARIDLHVFESSKQADRSKRLKEIWEIMPKPSKYSGLVPFQNSPEGFHPVLSLVCGPERYISSLAGPKINLVQGPIDGLLKYKGWSRENVYKLS